MEIWSISKRARTNRVLPIILSSPPRIYMHIFKRYLRHILGILYNSITNMGSGKTNAMVQILNIKINFIILIDILQKRKRHSDIKPESNGLDTSKPTAVFQPTRGRDWTVSVALPGSVIAKYVLSPTHSLPPK